MKRISTALIVVSIICLTTGCEKWRLDKQMEELCAKDGGVKVYETVQLPPQMFDPNGDPFPGWRKRKTEDRFGPEYRYEQTTEVLVSGDPLKGEGKLVRAGWKIIRKADEKLLGSDAGYARIGGDFIVIGHPSGAHCPVGHNTNTLIREVFIREEK